MTKRALLITGIIGLAAGIVAAVLINRDPFDVPTDFVAASLNVIAGGVAGRLILGESHVHRYFRLGMVLLAAIAAGVLSSATTSYLISQVRLFGPVSPRPTGTAIASGIIGLVVFLGAAILYWSAGRRQGVRTGSRIGLLFALLAAVVPVLNVLGLIGLTIVTIVRPERDPATRTTPVPPEASA